MLMEKVTVACFCSCNTIYDQDVENTWFISLIQTYGPKKGRGTHIQTQENTRKTLL